MKNSYFAAILALIFINIFSPLSAKTEFKDVEISGLKIYTEKMFIDQFGLKSLSKDGWHFRIVSRKINAFYQKNGYILARTYLIKEDRNVLKIAVDEGRLGRIIFYKLNTLDTLKIRQEFKLPDKVYNKKQVESEVARLKAKYKFKNIYALLKPAQKYDENIFQLDREYKIPFIGEARLPFMEKFDPRYDLEVYIIHGTSVFRKGMYYSLNIHYTKGLIPGFKYYSPSLFGESDLLVTDASVGIYYGLDLKFNRWPRYTFAGINMKYSFTPTLKDYFTPAIKASIYNSHESRKDLGLLDYNYTYGRALLEPGITLLKKLKVNMGFGGEKAVMYNSKQDPNSEHKELIESGTDQWGIVDGSIELDLIPWTLKSNIDRNFQFTYDYYFGRSSFHRLNFLSELSYEFKNFDLLSFRFDYRKIWGRVPFYQEFSVDGKTFKGFLGKSYYTRDCLRAHLEHRVSLYRDYIFGGIFADGTFFEGSGYDLNGDQFGFVAGLSCHFIFLEQFECNIYVGKDYLFSNGESQMNLALDLAKKW